MVAFVTFLSSLENHELQESWRPDLALLRELSKLFLPAVVYLLSHMGKAYLETPDTLAVVAWVISFFLLS